MARRNTNIDEQVLEESPVALEEEKTEEQPKTEPKKNNKPSKVCVA